MGFLFPSPRSFLFPCSISFVILLPILGCRSSGRQSVVLQRVPRVARVDKMEWLYFRSGRLLNLHHIASCRRRQESDFLPCSSQHRICHGFRNCQQPKMATPCNHCRLGWFGRLSFSTLDRRQTYDRLGPCMSVVLGSIGDCSHNFPWFPLATKESKRTTSTNSFVFTQSLRSFRKT